MNKVKMKRALMVLVCMFVAFVASAQTSKRVSASFNNEPLPAVLKKIGKQAGVRIEFVYDDVVHHRVTVKLTNATIKDAVEKVLGGTNLTYTMVNDRYITVKAKKKERDMAMTDKSLLRGKVTDSKGETLPGVTVMTDDRAIATTTDANGEFAIMLPKDGSEVLLFSFVGMKTSRMQIDGSNRNRMCYITMEDDSHQINEVVVTGIFKKAKESYTGAVTTISSEELKLHKGQNLLQTLRTIDASMNFQVNNLAGSNPNTLPQINIRGNSSLPMSVQEFNETTSNEVNAPLIILDGFEISLEKLMDYNDEEIENINILKDAAATAIYGSRGSNGVIVVTTRQPEAGKLRVNAEIGFDIEAPDLSSYDYLNAAEKLELEKMVGLYNGRTVEQDIKFKQAYNNKLQRILSGASTDWLNKPVHTGLGSHYNLRLEGGSEQFRWAVATSYKDTEGAMKNSYRRSFNGSVQLVYNLKNVIFKNYTSLGMVRSQESNFGKFSDYVAQQPYNSPYNEDGTLRQYFNEFYEGTISGYANDVANPLYDATLNTIDKSGHETLTNNFSIEWNITDDLTFRGQFGISKLSNTSDYFLPAEHSYFTTNQYGHRDEYATDEGFLRRGLYKYGTGNGYSYDGNATLSYSHVFADKHQLYVGADYSISEDNSTSLMFQVEGISNSDMPFIGNANQYAQNEIPSGSKMMTRRVGFTGNVNYTYDTRYYVDASYRIDGSSTFGSDKKWAPFWSTGIGWNLHNEKFLKENNIINILRLKASYGQTGSQAGSGSGANTIYNSVTGNKYMNWLGAQLGAWGNPLLTWQTTDELNIGTEFGLLNGRVKGEFNFYDKKTSNLLSNMDLPASMGLMYYVANVGEVRNRGWEASLSAYVLRDTKRDLNWLLTGQLVYNKNWISKLSDAIKAQTEEYLNQDVDVANLFYEGRPQNAIYAVRSNGIDPSTGAEMYVDRNGNITDTWKAGDKVFCGQSDPKYRGNFSSILRWKDVTFNATFSYYWGGKTYNQTLINRVEVTTNSLMSQNVDRRVFTDRWMKPGDVTFFKGFSNDETRATSRFVMDDNVLELASVSLQYRWHTDWIKNLMKVQSITFGVNASNLFYWGSVKQERGTSYPYARNIQGSIKLLF